LLEDELCPDAIEHGGGQGTEQRLIGAVPGGQSIATRRAAPEHSSHLTFSATADCTASVKDYDAAPAKLGDTTSTAKGKFPEDPPERTFAGLRSVKLRPRSGHHRGLLADTVTVRSRTGYGLATVADTDTDTASGPDYFADIPRLRRDQLAATKTLAR
jgi:hypothetical protein